MFRNVPKEVAVSLWWMSGVCGRGSAEAVQFLRDSEDEGASSSTEFYLIKSKVPRTHYWTSMRRDGYLCKRWNSFFDGEHRRKLKKGLAAP